MFRSLFPALLLLLPALSGIGFSGAAAPPDFSYATPAYVVELEYGDLAEGVLLQGTVATLGRTADLVVEGRVVSSVFTRATTAPAPWHVVGEQVVVANGVTSLRILYELAPVRTGVAEVSGYLKLTFLPDRIEQESSFRVPNAVFASAAEIRSILAWSSPFDGFGTVVGDGLNPGANGADLKLYGKWKNTAVHGAYTFDVAGDVVGHVRLETGAMANYLYDGHWRVGKLGSESTVYYNTFLDAPTIGIGRGLHVRDAYMFLAGATPEEFAQQLAAVPPSGPSVDTAQASVGHQAVIALNDDGINPYHVAFRDTGALAYEHPSTYLPGYPEDVPAVHLTLNATSLDAALQMDAATWASLEVGKLYWFPGTKIVGAMAMKNASSSAPGVIYAASHGLMTGSRAAGNLHSLCAECRIVMLQGFGTGSVQWAAEQRWIDVQSHSWSGFIPLQEGDKVATFGLTFPGLPQAVAKAAKVQAVFGSAGNGAAGKWGVAGHPSFTRSISGAEGAVSVGGHDNGYVAPWAGTWPHLVADVCDNWAPASDSTHDYDIRAGSGTSSSTPYAAGEAGRLILEARTILGGAPRALDGVLAAGTPPAGLVEGPLADGELTVEELKDLMFRTAVPRPVETVDDGQPCSALTAPYLTAPVKWTDVPEDTQTYPLIGWGQISVHSLAHALETLRGEAPLPARPATQAEHEEAERLRATYRDLP